MQREPLALDEAVEQVLDRIIERLTEEISEQGRLAGVKTINRGDKTDDATSFPIIWVYGEVAEITEPLGISRAIHEDWRLPVALDVVVEEADPEKGYRAASGLAARARSVLLKDRKLGLPGVRDVRSLRYEPSGPARRDGELYGATAVVDVRFDVFEP